MGTLGHNQSVSKQSGRTKSWLGHPLNATGETTKSEESLQWDNPEVKSTALLAASLGPLTWLEHGSSLLWSQLHDRLFLNHFGLLRGKMTCSCSFQLNKQTRDSPVLPFGLVKQCLSKWPNCTCHIAMVKFHM